MWKKWLKQHGWWLMVDPMWCVIKILDGWWLCLLEPTDLWRKRLARFRAEERAKGPWSLGEHPCTQHGLRAAFGSFLAWAHEVQRFGWEEGVTSKFRFVSGCFVVFVFGSCLWFLFIGLFLTSPKPLKSFLLSRMPESEQPVKTETPGRWRQKRDILKHWSASPDLPIFLWKIGKCLAG